jgi:putative membrane protein
MRRADKLSGPASRAGSTARLCLAAGVLALGAVAGPAAAQPSPMSTRDFISAAQGSDQFEILAADTAIAQTHDPRVRAFAQRMITDHTATTKALREAAVTSGAPLPRKALTETGEKFLAQIQGDRGPDFDRAYAKTQVLAHQEALAVEQTYARTGSNPAIRAAARAAVPIIAEHLQMAEQLKSEVGGS